MILQPQVLSRIYVHEIPDRSQNPCGPRWIKDRVGGGLTRGVGPEIQGR